jgi:putative CocE/NonD family hydrolase
MLQRLVGSIRAVSIVMGLIVACVSVGIGQQNAKPLGQHRVRFELSVWVPMRDGVELSTDLYFPEGAGNKLPVVLIRTPYNKKTFRRPDSVANFFASHGYVVAVQDTRGRYESQGDYTISTPDTEDGYDSTEWLATQVWSSGKVGTYGCSYLGDVQIMQARARNPHLSAMIPQAAGSNVPSRGFGASFGGANELAANVGWMWEYGNKLFLRPPPGAPTNFWAKYGNTFHPEPEKTNADYARMWRDLPVVDIMKHAGGPPTDWENLVTHGPGDKWWVDRGYLQETDKFDAPALQINSWYDFGIGETLYQMNLMSRNSLSPRGRENQFIVISPTVHCRSELGTEHTVVGERDLGNASFDYWNLYLRWFEYWLKGVENGVTKMPKLQIYVMGTNEWRGESEWPLARTQFTNYYLHSAGRANGLSGDGGLSVQAPAGEAPDTFVYDPGNPVPSRGGPVCCTGTTDAPAGSFDQRQVEARNDVLVYSTEPIPQGVEVTGPIKAILYVSSSAKDTDFTAKLVDVYPDGTAYNVQEGILRARYRDGWDKKVLMKSDEVYQVTIDLEATSNYFGPGHRIRLEISSSNFPRFDRNLNTGGNNYDETAWVVAHTAIHHSDRFSSHLILPVIPQMPRP